MKSFVIIGLGRFGENLAKTLFSMGYEVLAIDEDAEHVQHISDYVTHALVGDARDENVLRAAGVRSFDCAIVAMSQDLESNVLITLMLKELGVGFVVSKAQSDLHARVLKKIGADKIVFPEKDMGMKVAQSLALNNILDYIELSDSYSIVEIMTPSDWVGKTLRNLGVRTDYGVNVLAIRHGHNNQIEISPNPDEPLLEADTLVIIGANSDISKLSLSGTEPKGKGKK